MNRRHRGELTPNLIVGGGIIAATVIAMLAATSGWLVLAGPLLLAVVVVSADLLGSRLRGESAGPSRAALCQGIVLLLAGLIVALRDPSLVKTLLPILGASAWVTLMPRLHDRRTTCRGS